MKKIILLLAISFICISAFSMRYLVQTGATSWRTPGTEETLVDLTVNGQSLNAWLTATTFTSGDEVWIAKGTYLFTGAYLYPTSGLSLYGGFAGTETAVSERTIGADKWNFVNETVFDGNNAYRFITPSVVESPETVIDGITFTNGNGAEGPLKVARLMLVRNCKFTNNYTTTSGGAVINFGGDVISCYFKGNHGSFGGAMQIFNKAGDKTVVADCVFEENYADNSVDPTKGNQGGAIRVQGALGEVNIDKCTFINNRALLNGAAIYILAPTENENYSTVSNCLIYGSTIKHALYLYGGTVYNCTLVNNPVGGAYVGGAAITAKIYNSVFWGTSNSGKLDATANHGNAEVQNSAFQVIGTSFIGPLVMNNIVLDKNNNGEDFLAYYPNFVDPTANNWQLAEGSSLIDAGQTISTVTTDLLGYIRPYGTKYDIGAYEYDSLHTRVNSTIDYNFTYFSANNKLEVRDVSLNTPIKIYNLSGSLIKSFVSNSKDIYIDIEKGIYILNVGGQAAKVIVK